MSRGTLSVPCGAPDAGLKMMLIANGPVCQERPVPASPLCSHDPTGILHSVTQASHGFCFSSGFDLKDCLCEDKHKTDSTL